MARRRDMDLIRGLLLRIEEGEDYFETVDQDLALVMGTDPSGHPTREEAERLNLHLELLEGGGLVQFTRTGEGWFVDRITWAGYDFLDSIRDEEVWRYTKEGVSLAGGFTFELVKALAKGFLKKKIENLTGFDLAL